MKHFKYCRPFLYHQTPRESSYECRELRWWNDKFSTCYQIAQKQCTAFKKSMNAGQYKTSPKTPKIHPNLKAISCQISRHFRNFCTVTEKRKIPRATHRYELPMAVSVCNAPQRPNHVTQKPSADFWKQITWKSWEKTKRVNTRPQAENRVMFPVCDSHFR
jgi:hypothetical protein